MVWVGDTGFYGADFNTLRGFEETYTLSAFIGVNYINSLSLTDCLILTVSLAGATANTLVRNFISHTTYLLRKFPE